MYLTAFLNSEGTKLANEILDHIYVDNVFLMTNSEEDALTKINASRELFHKVGMNLRDFVASSTNVNVYIPDNIRGKIGDTKILGVQYSTHTDKIKLRIILPRKERITKRELVSSIHKAYDPLGLALPLLLEAKLLMRDVVLLNIGWNRDIPFEYLTTWNNICSEITGTCVEIPRTFVPISPIEQTLRSNQVDRIHKLRRILEAQGVQVILNYVESHHNPADIATRPVTKEQFEISDWLHGPKWMRTSTEAWPLQNIPDELITDHIDEKEHANVYISSSSSSTTVKQQYHLPIDLSRFRTYSQALRTFTRAMKTLSKWISRVCLHQKARINAPSIRPYNPDIEIVAEDMQHTYALPDTDEILGTETVGKASKNSRELYDLQKAQGLPFPHPDMAPLPSDRCIISKPFQHTGCGNMGPLNTDKGEKVYIALYTCLNTRAVHLDIVDSLSGAAFLDCFLRFISRRGVPSIMRSDCGANFILGAKVIDLLFEKNPISGHSVLSYSATNNIKWIFNPLASPWMGGIWERLVGTIKRCINKVIGGRRLSLTKLLTVITCIEAIINTRPITKIDPHDLTSLPLRPVDFLQGNIKVALPQYHDDDEFDDPNFEESTIDTVAKAREALAFSELIANKFWSTPVINEVVLIQQDDMTPRSNWPLGKITELVRSADGLIRFAKVRGPSGNVLQRPIAKLIPLEIRSIDESNENSSQTKSGPKPTMQLPEKPMHFKEVTQRRLQPPRKAKQSVKYVIPDENNDSDRQENTSQHHFNTSTWLYPLLFLTILCPAHANQLLCKNGHVFVNPRQQLHTLCFNNVCLQGSTTTHVYCTEKVCEAICSLLVVSSTPFVASAKAKYRLLMQGCKRLLTLVLLNQKKKNDEKGAGQKPDEAPKIG
ncbi:integrase core domain protein [Oesophagostomum dentatum]|uniref:Integrase core domain protein n=1 Tax=Oesophagostomum dentatum TaxID=61180 RepID=A0A0B1TPT0_OESDE|nr:integrase core domain protein [Oesophagostomum dentatum]